jgi:hypothetical protein
MVSPKHFDARVPRAVRKIQTFTRKNFNHNAPKFLHLGLTHACQDFRTFWKRYPDMTILEISQRGE